MYRKYREVWAEHRDRYGDKTALLYQVGGFFELYDTENLTTGTTDSNIRQIAELCQLSLTTHVQDSQTQTLFGGFPEHALAKFEKILVAAGFTVVVVVQKKGKSGAVEERIVDHIASPGCYVDNSVAERRLVGCVLESMSTGSAALRRVYWSVAALDVATGRIWFAEGVEKDRLHQFLCIHPPSELVLWSDGLPAANEKVDALRASCAATHLRALTPSNAAIEESVLETLWSPVRKRLEWLATAPQARRVLAGLMEFASEHVPSSLRSIGVPCLWIPDGEVRLGNAALEQLGLISLVQQDSQKQSLLSMMDQCRSVAGRRLMRSRLMRPISDVAELERRLDAIDVAASVSAAADTKTSVVTERCLRSLYDMSRLWRKLELGTVGISDMACLLRSYEASRSLLDVWPNRLENEVIPFLDWIAGTWDSRVMTELAREGITIPVTALPFTFPVEGFAEGLVIRAEAEALRLAWSGLGRGETLYLDDAEGGGFRITGTKRRIAAVVTVLRDAGDQSARVTPYKTTALLETAALDAINDRHRKWIHGWRTTWNTLWSSSVAEIVRRGASAHAALEAWTAELDLSWTVARISREWLWKRPVFVTDQNQNQSFIEATKLRHPILERLANGGAPYVSHDIALNGLGTEGPANNGFLLYGMNASGKSSLMKAVGICAILAQSGFPVPAETCRLAPFTAIFTRILGNDNLWAGQSSFAVEMTEFREILRYSDAHSLVLGDELCSGTESLSATALVAAGVETLVQRRAKFIFATHLHELATIPCLSHVKALHLRVHYDETTDALVYDRHLCAGSGSSLYGLEVCRALDLPAGYLERATALRQTLAGWKAPQASPYSADAVVSVCAVCSGSASLETHHIRPQADAEAAAAEGFNLNGPGNLVCLCGKCHDDHHAGRLVIQGWQETSAGRRLVWSRPVVDIGLPEDVIAWIQEQRSRKARISTIQRMVQQVFGHTVTEKQIKALK